VEALVAFAGSGLETALAPSLGRGIEAGGIALLRLTEGGKQFPAAPIGLYFARLWYYEKLYPLTASVAAFRRLQEWLAARDR
jgi:squalene-hopene/tetraprenyl-beta-curcumene cyclase